MSSNPTENNHDEIGDEAVLIDGQFGRYVPQRFAERYLDSPEKREAWGFSEADYQDMADTLLDGPRTEAYDEAWVHVLDHAELHDPSVFDLPDKWESATLYQDSGDVFLWKARTFDAELLIEDEA